MKKWEIVISFCWIIFVFFIVKNMIISDIKAQHEIIYYGKVKDISYIQSSALFGISKTTVIEFEDYIKFSVDGHEDFTNKCAGIYCKNSSCLIKGVRFMECKKR